MREVNPRTAKKKLKTVISDADRQVMERFNRKHTVLHENIFNGRYTERDVVREVVNTSVPVIFRKLRHSLDKGQIDTTDYDGDETVTKFLENFTSLFTAITIHFEDKKELMAKLWASIKKSA